MDGPHRVLDRILVLAAFALLTILIVTAVAVLPRTGPTPASVVAMTDLSVETGGAVPEVVLSAEAMPASAILPGVTTIQPAAILGRVTPWDRHGFSRYQSLNQGLTVGTPTNLPI